jgi:hypothetical protein
MRGAWSTLALVAVAAGLGAYIYFVDANRTETDAKEKVFTVAADDVEELRITAKGETSVLKKADGAWKLVEPVATDADQTEVTSLVSSLTGLEITREVDPKAPDLAEFGLTAPKADITYTAKGGATGRVRLGDQTPTGGDLYAVKGDDPRVFLVPTFVETNLSRNAFDLRDKRVLRFERDKADGLEITNGAATAALSRADSEWRVTAPVTARGDYGTIEGLLTRLSTGKMTSIEAGDVNDLAKFGLDKPATTVVVKTGSSAATLHVSADKDGKVYARDLARPLVFVVDGTLATDVRKGVDDYRRKQLFEFRPFSAKTLALTRGTDTVTLTKVPGSGENPADKWTVTTAGATRDAETAKVDDLLSKLSNVAADEFLAAVPPGAATPVLKVSALYDENKKEEASLARSGADAFGTRADEAGAVKLNPTTVDDVLKALDAVLAPPAPPAPPPTPPPAANPPPEKKQ